MSRQYKCDRCARVFSTGFGTTAEVSAGVGLIFTLDLCASCASDLREWLKIKPDRRRVNRVTGRFTNLWRDSVTCTSAYLDDGIPSWVPVWCYRAWKFFGGGKPDGTG